MEVSEYKYVIVGSGFLGSIIAERITNVLGQPVLVIEKRNHIGGNCYSEIDVETGIEYHAYGTHIFHTSNEKVWGYINKFTSFNNYNHQVLTNVCGKIFQLPINLETINSYFNINLRPYEVDDFLKTKIGADFVENPSNFEEKTINLVGRELYNAFIKGYTEKQWCVNPKTLPTSLIKRLPFRKNYNESYYFSKYQGIPINGYTAIFNKLLSSPLIDLRLNTDFFDLKPFLNDQALIVYSGSIDRYFDYRLGKLKWRTLHFEKEIHRVEDYQGTSVMNYPDSNIPYTRKHEPRHLHPERSYTINKTVVLTEYSLSDNGKNPYYPIPVEENMKLATSYRELVNESDNLIVAGRLGDYKYYDMHETIARALEIFENEIIYRKQRP
jgi:UDP-galactopyranose mutase